MNSAIQTLIDRGFVKDCTDYEGLSELMDKNPVTFYCGVDPTGPSLHVGHIVPFFAMHHLQEAGHNPICLVGGGTGLIGDPSGKTEMRKILPEEAIRDNVKRITGQLGKIVDLSDNPPAGCGKARIMNNADWLVDLNYIRFLRDVGVYFSVNRMLTFEGVKQRLERGLSFIEFNYQLLQSYDFHILNERAGCRLQIGGADQWGNIVAGIDLIQRMGGEECFEYWRNVADADAVRFMKLFTFLSLDEIKEYEDPKRNINDAKARLAYEVTKIVHGEEEAEKAKSAAAALFSSSAPVSKEGMPSAKIAAADFENGIGVLDLFTRSGLTSSNGDARRLVTQGGAEINGKKISDPKAVVTTADLDDGELLLKAGKKRFMRVIAE